MVSPLNRSAGNATISVRVSGKSGETNDLELRTNMNPREAVYGDYKITFVGLQPHPKSGSETKKSDYTAIFIVHHVG